MRRFGEERGIVVIFALVLMGAVAMIATAFAVLVRTEKKAARNSCLAAQAELGALSGLENAIRAIKAANETYSLVSCPDGALDPAAGTFSAVAGGILSGWHRYFEAEITGFYVDSPNADAYCFGVLDVGKEVHNDDTAVFTDVGGLQGEPYILTTDSDAASTSNAFISFEVSTRTAVLVGFAGDPPSWTNPDWTNTGAALTSGDGSTYFLYARTFVPAMPSLTVELGGNEGSGGRMYVVVLRCGVSLSNPAKWVWHYLGQDYAPGLSSTVLGHVMRGRIFRGAEVRIGAPWYEDEDPDDAEPPQLHELKYASEYAGCVVDLDGKLHSMSSQWGQNLSGDAVKSEIEEACFAELVAENIFQTGDAPSFFDPAQAPRSIREIAATALPKPPSPTQPQLEKWQRKTYAVETCLRPYPIGPDLARVNVNTARTETIRAALCQVPGLKADEARLDLVVNYVASRRPYASRAEFEDALFLATAQEDGKGFVSLNWRDNPAEADEKYLTEKEFNDILNSAATSAELSVDIWPHTAREGDGTLSDVGTVRVPVTLEENLTVNLRSSNTSAATVPATVVILGGESSASFDVTVDGDVDGDKKATITASAVGYLPGAHAVHVLDSEGQGRFLPDPPNPPVTATEGGTLSATINVAEPLTENLTVSLLSTDTTEATVPPTVVIPAVSGSATFNVTVQRDGIVDGSQGVSIIASAPGYRSGWIEAEIEDDGSSFADPNESVYDDPDLANKGQYSFDGWEDYSDGEGPSQTGGDCTVADEDVTWGCEFKFTSRYFHVYSVGLVREPATARVLARKKLHAVYDAEADRLLWFRWNVTERGNIGDYIAE